LYKNFLRLQALGEVILNALLWDDHSPKNRKILSNWEDFLWW
jgi:hypothetical protein